MRNIHQQDGVDVHYKYYPYAASCPAEYYRIRNIKLGSVAYYDEMERKDDHHDNEVALHMEQHEDQLDYLWVNWRKHEDRGSGMCSNSPSNSFLARANTPASSSDNDYELRTSFDANPTPDEDEFDSDNDHEFSTELDPFPEYTEPYPEVLEEYNLWFLADRSLDELTVEVEAARDTWTYAPSAPSFGMGAFTPQQSEGQENPSWVEFLQPRFWPSPPR